MRESNILGARVPSIKLGYLVDGEVTAISTDELFAGGKTVVLGIPGAFTPVCTQQHVPDFVANAEKIVASGYRQVLCIAPNDPFVLEAWRCQMDPHQKIRFLSDGNLEFARALGLGENHHDLFLGNRSKRYMLIIHDQTIQRVRVETSILTYACTGASDVLELA